MGEEAIATGVSIKVKLDDLSLYYRRIALERLGVAFELEPGTFPLQWRALWGDHRPRPRGRTRCPSPT